MSEYIENLKPDNEALLASIIGRPSVGFYFPEVWIDTSSDGIITSSISIPTGKKQFVIIDCAYYETANDFIDVSPFRIGQADRPKDITVTPDENGASGWAFEHVSTLLTWSPTVIHEITILEELTEQANDTVRADRGILFSYEKGRLLIMAGGAFPDQLKLVHLEASINASIENLTKRKRLSSSDASVATV